MSDTQLYNILENFNKVVKKTINEDTTRIRKVGANTEVDDGKGDKTVYDEKSWDDHTDDDTDEKSMGATGFNESEGGGQKFGVYSVGGSIGGKKSDKPIKTYDTKAEAQADAKRRRKQLSPGEKGYYKMGYKVKPISEGIEDDIINDKYASDLDIDAPDEFSLGDFSTDTDFDLGDDDIGMDFSMEGYGDELEIDSDFEAPDVEVDDDLFNDPDFSAGSDFDLGDDDIGMDFSVESQASDEAEWASSMGYDDDDEEEMIGSQMGDDFEEPDYTPFDHTAHGKRLRAGTPIVFDDSIGGGTGTFIEKSPSGFFGTAERNGKSIKIHMSDIVAADLINDSIYENFETQFSKLMEGMEGLDMSAGQTAYDPAAQSAQTVTVTADIPVDSLVDILKLTGLGGEQEEVYQQYGQEEVPTGQEMAQEPDMQSMLDTVSDDEPENEGYDPDSEEADYYRDEQQDRDDNHDDDDDEDPFGEKPRRDDDGYEIDEAAIPGTTDAALLHKVAQVIKSVQTPEQYQQAAKYAQQAFKNIRRDTHNTKTFGSGYSHLISLAKDVDADLSAKAQELGVDSYQIESSANEGVLDNVKRGFNKAFWWDGLRSPEEVQNRVRQMSDEELESIAGQGIDDQQAGGSGTPRAFQVKAIDRELRRRGLRDFKKYGDSRKMTDSVEEDYANEPDERIASADTQLNAMSGGLNKQKRQFNKGYPGDNSMQVDEDSTESFLNLYKKFSDL